MPYKPLPNGGLVHQGFQIVYYAMRQSLLDAVKAARQAYPALTSALITGHSLGAAVAGLLAPDLIQSGLRGLSTLVYTLAEPRVGHPTYAHFYNTLVPVC